MGYFKDTARGISWMAALRGASRAITFVRLAILARILTPAQFGLFGIASLLLAFLEIITETGINVFLVQEEGELEDYLPTAWVVSILRGVLISVLILLSAPFIANFFRSPESLRILFLISLVPFLRGFINPSIVKFQKELEFNKEFFFRFSIFSFESLVVIVAAFLTRSAESLVFGLIAATFLEVIVSIVWVAPRPRLAFELAKVQKVVSRGKWLTAAGLFNYAFQQGDDIVVGRLLNTTSLGLYQVAYRISTLPITEIGEIFNKVTFPVYTRIRGDSRRLKNAFLKVSLAISALVIPFGLILFFFPREIILIVLGDKWLGAIEAVRVLAIFGIVRSFSGLSFPLFLAFKKQEYITSVTLVSIVGLALTIIPLVGRFGIMGAALSALIGSIIAVPATLYFLVKIFSK